MSSQRNIQLNTTSAAQQAASVDGSVEEKEVKFNHPSKTTLSIVRVCSISIFSTKPLDMLCMEKLLSQEHKLGNICHQLPALLHDKYIQFKQEKLKQVLEAIGQGDPDTVYKMTEEYPILLLEELEEKDFVVTRSGQKTAQKTPYQMALAEEDTQMAEKLRAQLISVADEKEADAQFNKQRPKGWEVEDEKKWQPVFAQLDTLTQAIRRTVQGDITSSGHPEYKLTIRAGSKVAIELAKFWSLLDAILNEIVTTGRHFNPKLLLKAWETYDDDNLYQEYFGGKYGDPRALLFWQKVIGYDGIQRTMPANYVQAFHNWLDTTVKKLQSNQPQDRSTRFEIYRAGNWVPVDFYPLRERGSSDFNFAIGAGRQVVLADGRWVFCGALLSKLMSIKNSRLTDLIQHQDSRHETSRSCCVIM